ncbi:hypothetical protein KJ925_05670 [Patescibacteria group bacterium]|uniref:Uncharacterized protein n=1 Tax=viral metagenome TaxID=1070528 RepID=A0A6H2A4W4_9ZZZZ|nr:hypothetical protein [Patescibacteria group bacterium]
MMDRKQADRIIALLERIADTYPAREDIQFFTPDTDTVPAGTALTVTFTLRRDFEIVITELYCDTRANCSYYWIFGGVKYELNEVAFSHGKRLREGGDWNIILRISNTGTTDVEVGYYLKGWARRKG